MSIISRLTRLAVATAAAGALGILSPAVAETAITLDAPNDMGYRADIQSVRLAYNADAVRVTISHKDLTADGRAGGRVYFDANENRPGPEYVFLAGFSDGTDYGLFRMRSTWGLNSTRVSQCDNMLRLRYAKEASVVTVDSACLRDPSKIRVGLRLSTDTKHGTKVDWLGGKRTLTDWVTRG